MSDIEFALSELKINLGLTVEELDLPQGEESLKHTKEWIKIHEVAISSIEKRIPSNPNLTKNPVIGEYYKCNCGGILKPYAQKYCQYCGQAINWKGESPYE